jgi:hypothetical protein
VREECLFTSDATAIDVAVTDERLIVTGADCMVPATGRGPG